MLRIGVKNRVTDLVLGRGVCDGPQQREATAFAVHGVLPRGKRDVLANAGAALPDAEPDEPQPFEDAFGEMKLRVGQLARAPVCLFAGSPSK